MIFLTPGEPSGAMFMPAQQNVAKKLRKSNVTWLFRPNTKIQGSGSIINTYLSTSRSTCKWIRQGDIVTVYFQITASDAIPNEVPIINNFPKPISNVYSAAPSNNTSNPSFAYTINTNGELYRNYGGALNAGETCYGSITYITEDT